MIDFQEETVRKPDITLCSDTKNSEKWEKGWIIEFKAMVFDLERDIFTVKSAVIMTKREFVEKFDWETPDDMEENEENRGKS